MYENLIFSRCSTNNEKNNPEKLLKSFQLRIRGKIKTIPSKSESISVQRSSLGNSIVKIYFEIFVCIKLESEKENKRVCVL